MARSSKVIHNCTCRHQERGDVLFIENARLGQDLETQKLNLADINEFLTSEIEASSKKLKQVEDKAAALQQQVDDVMDTHTVCISGTADSQYTDLVHVLMASLQQHLQCLVLKEVPLLPADSFTVDGRP